MPGKSQHHRSLGNIIAPPRFVAYVALLLLSAAIALTQDTLPHLLALLIGFDVATAIFLASMLPLLRIDEARDIAKHAEANDANRPLLLVVSTSISLFVMAAVAGELQTGRTGISTIVSLASLALAWLSGNAIYALHYAHLYYSAKPGTKGLAKGIEFPSTDKPDYRDFLHFSLIMGMTFQTADISISSPRIRWVSTGQCIAAFVFNLGIVAFSINMLAS